MTFWSKICFCPKNFCLALDTELYEWVWGSRVFPRPKFGGGMPKIGQLPALLRCAYFSCLLSKRIEITRSYCSGNWRVWKVIRPIDTWNFLAGNYKNNVFLILPGLVAKIALCGEECATREGVSKIAILAVSYFLNGPITTRISTVHISNLWRHTVSNGSHCVIVSTFYS